MESSSNNWKLELHESVKIYKQNMKLCRIDMILEQHYTNLNVSKEKSTVTGLCGWKHVKDKIIMNCRSNNLLPKKNQA